MTDRIEHDLNLLPQWGPYTKKYIGVSHISDKIHGIRFDLSIFPGVYRRKTELPNVMFETNHFPWYANTRLTHYKFRHMIEWKDLVFCDVDYLLHDENTQAFKANFVNNTNVSQTLALHFLASIHFAGKKEYEPDNYLQPAIVNLAKNVAWINSNQYIKYITNEVLPTDNLNPDGKFKYETLEDGYVNGSRIEFAHSSGDSVTYDLSITSGNIIKLRYHSTHDTSVTLKLDNNKQLLQLPKNDEPTLISLAKVDRNYQQITLIANESNTFYLDGLLIGNENCIDKTTFELLNLDTTPEIIKLNDTYILKYPQIPQYYGINFFAEDYELREFISDNLDTFFAKNANEHVQRKMIDKLGEHHYTNWYLRPLNVKANHQHDIYGLVTCGSYADVISKLEKTTLNHLQKDFHQLAKEYAPVTLGQQIISATMLSNVVYPVYTCGKYIRHSTPGRWWDCLYTWDSGFIGLGLLELDIERAKENLRVYLTSKGAENKFIHHGSPVPVQFYLANEIFNKSSDITFISSVFTSLLQYYRFLRGSVGSSDTNRFKSGLLQTWSYFYNSGGWDDYPAQKHCHDNNIIRYVTPVITTAHVIRAAKILLKFAMIVDSYNNVINELTNDIQTLSSNLNKYSWDNECGYYSYVMHDSDGNAITKLTAPDDSNFNQGLDGLYPLISDTSNEHQTSSMLRHLQNPAEIFSPIGLSAVSQTASYYCNDGYWNGTIWFSHQWFFWKAMFDHIQHEFADKIAKTALDIWEQECGLSYRSLEHFVIETGRGAGWSNFSGLSCPQINWFHAYYTPYRINLGLDCSLLEQTNSKDYVSFRVQKFTNKPSLVLFVVPSNWNKFECYINDQIAQSKTTFSKIAYWLELPNSSECSKFNILIKRI
ncbi:MAG: hypothetical protein E6Q32_05805 [Neisseriales bacterium]|nr:MAG: hypothetical protein E6Q32_05805 [Neisseriales bacterium]